MADNIFQGVPYRGIATDFHNKTAEVVEVRRDLPSRCRAKFNGIWYFLPTSDFALRPSQLAHLWNVQGRN